MTESLKNTDTFREAKSSLALPDGGEATTKGRLSQR